MIGRLLTLNTHVLRHCRDACDDFCLLLSNHRASQFCYNWTSRFWDHPTVILKMYKILTFLILTREVKIDLNPQSAEYNYLNYHPLEVVSRYRDPHLQVGEIIHICLI